MKYSALYLGSIVLVNYLFMIVPSVGMWQPVSLVVGGIFILRDYAQREIGHKVLFVMLIGGVLSYYLASPFVALASMSAFLISEVIDWVVYTTTKKPMKQRILISSLISTPVDSAVFLAMINHFDWISFSVMTLSKLLSAFIIWRRL